MKSQSQLYASVNIQGGKRVSPDFSNIRCRINGPFVIGSVNQISASWSPAVETPNNTDVDVSFTVQGFMAPDSFFPVPINPNDAISDTKTITAISQSGNIEMRKRLTGPSNYRINRDGSGNPISITVPWAVTMGLVNPDDGNAKGVNSSALGEITFDDDLSALGEPFQNATLGNCGVGVAGDDTALPIGLSSVPNPNGNRGTVKNAGTFSCVQAGGSGSLISVTNSGVNYDAEWFPFGYSNTTPEEWFGFNYPGRTDEVWNSPSGLNNHAVISGGYVETIIPWDDIIDFDQKPGDRSQAVGSINFCNTVSNLAVVGDNPGYLEPLEDNTACATVINRSTINVQKKFSLGTPNNDKVDDIKGNSAVNFGGAVSDNIVYPGEKLFSSLSYSNDSNSTFPIENLEMCDAIDTNNLQITDSSFYTDLGTYNSFVLDNYVVDPYSAKLIRTFTNVPGFTVPDESNVIVEFARVAPMSTSAELQALDCEAGSIAWHLDPNDVTGGIENANMIRVRFETGASLPPGRRLEVSIPMQVKQDKVPGDVVQNVMAYRSSTNTIAGGTNSLAGGNGNWAKPNSSCRVYDWSQTNGNTGQCDRALVVPATGHLEITDNQDALVTGNTHNQVESMKAVQAGQNWSFDVRASMAYLADLSVTDAKVFIVLPEGLSYKSSTLAPSKVITECDATINISCITTPEDRTHIGHTTIVFELGDFDFAVPDGHNPATTYYKEGFFGFWKVTTSTNGAFTSGMTRQTKSWMEVSGGLADQSTVFPNSQVAWSVYFDNAANGLFDDDWIMFTQAAQFIIYKATPDSIIPIDGVGRYDISYANSSGSAKTFDFIDILPFNGDGRVPNTSFAGDYSLSNIDFSRSPGISAVYITSAVPSSLNNDPNSNVPVGTGIWACQYSQMDTVGCPSTNDVTGIRFITSSLAVNAFETVRISIDTDGNVGRDIYTNNAAGRASGLAGVIRSEDVSFTTSLLRVGNRIFDDRNNNGIFDDGDVPLSGVTVELRDLGEDKVAYNNDDSTLTRSTSDAQGQYFLSVPENGSYYVRIAPTDIEKGGIIQFYTAQKDGNTVDDVDSDEDIDHDAVARDISTIRTPVFNINEGTEPTSEIGESLSLDSSSNLTVDFGLVRPVTIGNLVWRDRNKNGIQDQGEEGIAGVQITATWYGPDEVLGGGDDYEFTTTSSSEGTWQILGPAGRYSVEFVAPNGYTSTLVDVGLDSSDSDKNGVTESLSAGESNFDFDFGFYTQEDTAVLEKNAVSNGRLPFTGSSRTILLVGVSFAAIVIGGFFIGLTKRKRRIVTSRA